MRMRRRRRRRSRRSRRRNQSKLLFTGIYSKVEKEGKNLERGNSPGKP